MVAIGGIEGFDRRDWHRVCGQPTLSKRLRPKGSEKRVLWVGSVAQSHSPIAIEDRENLGAEEDVPS